ncbi:MAG: ABC transporter ATP-binding protein [Spirochaetales bacterium]|nr:ABC transporter ATP-binding protein [Spirochaetales bacterium]
MSLVEITDLSISFHTHKGVFSAVKNISLSITKGECLALVGESGAGKSVTAHSILRLLPQPESFYPTGSILFHDVDMLKADEITLQKIRGNRITMIFQEPMTSLNPLHTIIKQVAESLIIHQGLSKQDAEAKAIELLHDVQFPEAESRAKALPHELSGGQRQRVMIAMALANNPELLIADEPTTALDVTIQAELLKLLKALQKKYGMALLLITHDLGIVRKIADRAAIMRNGIIIEQDTVNNIFSAPKEEYTRELIGSEPSGKPVFPVNAAKTLLQAGPLSVSFPMKKTFFGRPTEWLNAVKNAEILITEGTTLGIVGESGSGKTTLAFALLRLVKSKGPVVFQKKHIDSLKSGEIRPLRREMQIVFQDPFGSLNPRLTIGKIVGEGLEAHDITRKEEKKRQLVETVLTEVGIDPDAYDRYPHEFSGGQRQRISIARALVLKPRLVVLDEPTSSLDLTVQAQIIDLLRELQNKHHLTFIFISHDLRVVRALSHFVAVMEKGIIVEQGPADIIFDKPEHPYTQKLIEAAFLFSQT